MAHRLLPLGAGWVPATGRAVAPTRPNERANRRSRTRSSSLAGGDPRDRGRDHPPGAAVLGERRPSPRRTASAARPECRRRSGRATCSPHSWAASRRCPLIAMSLHVVLRVADGVQLLALQVATYCTTSLTAVTAAYLPRSVSTFDLAVALGARCPVGHPGVDDGLLAPAWSPRSSRGAPRCPGRRTRVGVGVGVAVDAPGSGVAEDSVSSPSGLELLARLVLAAPGEREHEGDGQHQERHPSHGGSSRVFRRSVGHDVAADPNWWGHGPRRRRRATGRRPGAPSARPPAARGVRRPGSPSRRESGAGAGRARRGAAPR